MRVGGKRLRLTSTERQASIKPAPEPKHVEFRAQSGVQRLDVGSYAFNLRLKVGSCHSTDGSNASMCSTSAVPPVTADLGIPNFFTHPLPSFGDNPAISVGFSSLCRCQSYSLVPSLDAACSACTTRKCLFERRYYRPMVGVDTGARNCPTRQ